jgi:hypothetical protein
MECLLTEGARNVFTTDTLNADSGATCHLRGSLNGMLNLKPSVTDIIVGNKESRSNVSKGDYKGIVLQKEGTSMELSLHDIIFIPNSMV